MTDFELSPRKREILLCAVEKYIESASPITSGGIGSNILDNLSSATIRNELNALEAMGYLKQLHTSGGRIPTTKGYRFFVNELSKECPADEEQLEFIRNQFLKRSSNLQDAVGKLANLVSEATNYPTVVILSGFGKLKINEIKIIPLMTKQALMLIQTTSGILNNTIELNENISEETCEDVSRYLTNKLQNITIAEMMQNIEHIHKELENEIAEYNGFFDYVLSTLVEITREFKTQQSIQASGSAKLLNNPEYADVEKVKEIIDALHDVDQLHDLLIDVEGEAEISFKIGDENSNDAFKDCSIAKADCRVNGESIASIGIIGPKRMDYAKISSALKFIVDETKKMNLLGTGEENQD